jgi:hypothetical protein
MPRSDRARACREVAAARQQEVVTRDVAGAAGGSWPQEHRGGSWQGVCGGGGAGDALNRWSKRRPPATALTWGREASDSRLCGTAPLSLAGRRMAEVRFSTCRAEAASMPHRSGPCWCPGLGSTSSSTAAEGSGRVPGRKRGRCRSQGLPSSASTPPPPPAAPRRPLALPPLPHTHLRGDDARCQGPAVAGSPLQHALNG